MVDNPDRVLLAQFLASAGAPMLFDATPLAAALGAQLVAADVKTPRLTMRFRPGPIFAQGASMLQGGAVAGMLDFAIAGVVLMSLDADATAATVSLNVSFLAAARPGVYEADGIVDRAGQSIVFARASLRDVESDCVVALGNGVMAVRRA